MQSKRSLRIASLLATLLALAAPLVVSVLFAKQQSLREQQGRAELIASEILHRSQTLSGQVVSAIDALEQSGNSQPCSAAGVRRMRELVYQYSQLVDVGYVDHDHLLCSSYGYFADSIALPPADYLSKSGYYIRNDVVLPLGDSSRLRISTRKSSGYAALLHPELAIDIATDDLEMSVGVIVLSSRTPLYKRGTFDASWVDQLQGRDRAGWADDHYVVSLQKSNRFDYAAYVAIPMQRVKDGWWRLVLPWLPIALLVGVALAVLVQKALHQRMSMASMLRSGIRKNELFLEYQPVVDLQTGAWLGAEALVRWKTPDGKLVSPNIFIPIAEHHQLVSEITQKVIAMALRDIHALLALQPNFHLAINFSAQDFAKEDLAAQLATALRQSGVKPHHLVAEATERVFMDVDVTKRNLQALRKLGVRVAIDDFGTGYSSLSYLTTLPVDCLKIDKAFVDTIGTDAATSQVVTHIIAMAKSLNLEMVAEGVETQVQADYLRAQGVQFAQGWLFARAMPLAQLLSQLAAVTKA